VNPSKSFDGLLLPLDDIAFSKFAIVNNGRLDGWGEHEFNIVSNHLSNKRTCLDIGAHVGLTSLRYSKHFTNVHAFEPFHHEMLQENVKHCDNVTVHPFAVDEQEGETIFYIHPTNSGSGFTKGEGTTYLYDGRYRPSESDRPGGRFESIAPVIVPTRSIDSYNFQDVDFVKIDVEGNNIPVLLGMINTLKRCKPVIQIEDSTYPPTNTTANQMLLDLGYTEFESYGKPIDRFYK
jgi:FkbM family methyltransferase